MDGKKKQERRNFQIVRNIDINNRHTAHRYNITMHLFWAASYMKQMCGVSDAMPCTPLKKPKQKTKSKLLS